MSASTTAPAAPFSLLDPPPATDALRDTGHEQAILAAILLKPELLDALPAGFGASHFSFQDHAEIYEAATAAAATGANYLAPAVETALPHLAGPGGYVRELQKALLGLRPGDIAAYAERLMELSARRALVVQQPACPGMRWNYWPWIWPRSAKARPRMNSTPPCASRIPAGLTITG